MKLRAYLVAIMAVIMSSLGVASAATITIEYADGTKISGEKYIDRAGHLHIITEGKRNYVDLNKVKKCTGTTCPSVGKVRKRHFLIAKKSSESAAKEKTTTAKNTLTEQKKPIEAANIDNSISTTLSIYGSNTIGAKLMPGLIKAYAKTLPGSTSSKKGSEHEQQILTISDQTAKLTWAADLHARGSGTAFKALAEGKAELGMASRPIKSKEEALLSQVGVNDMRSRGQEHIVALDGLAVIVSSKNAINSLSLADIAGLFAGKITNWSQLGGADQAVTVYAHDNQSGTFDTFKSLVLKPNKVKLADTAKRFESHETLSKNVATDAGGIGFVGLAYIGNSKALALKSDCGIESQPDIFKMKAEEYPLARRLYLYNTDYALSPYAKGLLDYSLSDEAQVIIRGVGFVDQTLSGKGFTQKSQRIIDVQKERGVPQKIIDQFVNQLVGAKRLSTTFRFENGNTELDIKAKQDLDRIAVWMEQRPNDKRRIYLVGFSDATGEFDKNLQLSKQLAEYVAALLKERLPENFHSRLGVLNYGKLSPVACNTNERGRSKNRRVEVWLK